MGFNTLTNIDLSKTKEELKTKKAQSIEETCILDSKKIPISLEFLEEFEFENLQNFGLKNENSIVNGVSKVSNRITLKNNKLIFDQHERVEKNEKGHNLQQQYDLIQDDDGFVHSMPMITESNKAVSLYNLIKTNQKLHGNIYQLNSINSLAPQQQYYLFPDENGFVHSIPMITGSSNVARFYNLIKTNQKLHGNIYQLNSPAPEQVYDLFKDQDGVFIQFQK